MNNSLSRRKRDRGPVRHARSQIIRLTTNSLRLLVTLVLAAACPSCHRTTTNVDRPIAKGARDAAKTLANAMADDKSKNESPWFQDATKSAGIDFVHVRADTIQYWLPEITSGGLGWIDFDNDGDQDLYFVQGGQLGNPSDTPVADAPANVMYRNNGDGTFRDVTQRAGVGDQHYGMGVAVGDYDGDGYLDMYVTNVGPNVLYRNQGDGTFDENSEAAGVADDGWGTSAAFVDYDRDGDEDLFVVNYLRWSPEIELTCLNGSKQQDYCAPGMYQSPSVDKLYRNRGDGTFEDASYEVGLAAAAGNGLGLAVGDFNQDGRLDFYVANDGNPNQLWIQDANGNLQDEALLSGCAVNRVGSAEAGMGVAPVDVDQDGDLDLFMTHLVNESNTLYLNHDGVFEDVTSMRGLAAPSLEFTSFGMGFIDFDHDTQIDLYVANGRVSAAREPSSPRDPFAEPNQLFRGVGEGNFVEVLPRGGRRQPKIETSRGAAFADYNRDGRVDVAVVNSGGPAQLLANQAGQSGNWIRFHLVDRIGRVAIGARVRVRCGAIIQWRTVQRTYSFTASNEPVVHFGIGSATEIDDVNIEWPDGSKQSLGATNANQSVTLSQPPE